MTPITWALLAVLISLFIYAYVNMAKKLKYWAERGVPHVKPLPFIGNVNISGFKSFNMLYAMTKLYNAFPEEKYVGYYTFTKPIILIRDPELLERIMVKDFQHFMDHGTPIEDKSTILNLGLFSLIGNEWRALRFKIAPTFTTGKLKGMFDEILTCVENMVKNLDDGPKECYDLRGPIATFGMDVVSKVIFGIEFTDKELRDKYMDYSDKAFQPSLSTFILLLIGMQFPKLAIALGFKIMDPKVEKFFRNIIMQTFEQRKKSGIERNDYLQMLLKLKEQGSLELKPKDPEDEYLGMEDSSIVENIELTDDILIAQAFQFLAAGFEPFQNTMMFSFFELAQNEDVQNKLRKEINDVLKRNSGYSYKALKEMTYLDQCINETLRKYPAMPFLPRVCTKTYQVDEKLTLEKGATVFVSLYALHMDPKHFPDPERFDPDRFDPDTTRKGFTFLPFGAGPRFCIGMRFALMKLKIGIARVIENYSLRVNPKTKIPLEMNLMSFFISPKPVYFDLTKIN